jgi:hypothetical protein
MYMDLNGAHFWHRYACNASISPALDCILDGQMIKVGANVLQREGRNILTSILDLASILSVLCAAFLKF